MDYHKIYNQLIERARVRTLNDYSEKHHIIPKCQGGTDDESNLVRLTPEEHYLAHQLLVKMNPGNAKLVFAVHMMNCGRTTNKLYGWIRRKHQVINKPSLGKLNSPEVRKKISLANIGNTNWLGKKHSSASILKMRKSAIGKHVGQKNSQFGLK